MTGEVAAVLGRLLAGQDMTVDGAARAAGCSRSHLSRVLHRKIRPSLGLAGRLDTVLDADGALATALLLDLAPAGRAPRRRAPAGGGVKRR